MPIVAVFDPPSLTQEVYEESVRLLTDGKGLNSPADWPVDGLLAHVAGPSETGFRVIDVWESEEAFGKFGETLIPILQQLGVNEAPKVNPVQTVITG